MSRRVPSLRCHVRASLIVSSLRPSFPLLRRSPPIPSLPWLLAADLFRGCSARRDSLPCHSAASQCTSIPSHRCFAVSLMVGSKLCYSAASPVRAVPHLAIAYPICSVHFPCCSSEFNAGSSLLVSYRVASPPCRFVAKLFRAFPSRLLSQPILAFPLRLHSQRLSSIRCLLGSYHLRVLPCHCRSVQSLSRQFSAFASPFGSLPCHFLSAHLRLHRSWPFPCSSHRFGSWLYRLISTGCDALPYQIISATVSAEPFLRFSILR